MQSEWAGKDDVMSVDNKISLSCKEKDVNIPLAKTWMTLQGHMLSGASDSRRHACEPIIHGRQKKNQLMNKLKQK